MFIYFGAYLYSMSTRFSTLRTAGKLAKGVTKGLAKLALVAYVGSQAYYRTQDVKDIVAPSAEREAINKQAGVRFIGPRSAVEENPRIDGYLAVLTEQHKRFGHLPVSFVIVNDRPWYAATPIEQMSSLLTRGHDGYYNPITGMVLVQSNASSSTLKHELAHAHTVPALLGPLGDSLRATMRDEQGNSLYRSIPSKLALRLKYVDKVISDEAPRSGNADKYGFPSDYAQTDVYEHVAEMLTDLGTEGLILQWTSDSQGLGRKAARLVENAGFMEPGTAELRHIKHNARRDCSRFARICSFADTAEVRSTLDSLLIAHPDASWRAEALTLKATTFLRHWNKLYDEKLDRYTFNAHDEERGRAAASLLLEAIEVGTDYAPIHTALTKLSHVAGQLDEKQLECRVNATLRASRVFNPQAMISQDDLFRMQRTAWEANKNRVFDSRDFDCFYDHGLY
jgi:hypothetical protein